MDAGAADCLPYTTEPGSNIARVPGLLATDQMETLHQVARGKVSVGNYLIVIDDNKHH